MDEESLVLKHICGSEMYLDTDDDGISSDLLEKLIREPHTTTTYMRELSRLDGPLTVVDIGANIGYYALQPPSLRGDVHVVAFEPGPENFDLLQKNIEVNGYGDQITAINCGIGDEEREEKLHISRQSNLHTMQHSRRGVSEVSVDVLPLPVALDSIGLSVEEIDVIRMDVEGYEAKVLRGMGEIFDARNHLLCNIEFHPVLMTEDENEFIRGLFSGFSIISSAQNDNQLSDETTDEAFERNWVEVVFEWEQ